MVLKHISINNRIPTEPPRHKRTESKGLSGKPPQLSTIGKNNRPIILVAYRIKICHTHLVRLVNNHYP